MRSDDDWPVVVWDHLAVDEQDASETQGTIVVSTAFTVDDCWADPGRDSSANRVLECAAGLSAPVGLLLLHKLKERRTWLRAGDRDCWIEVDASCGVLCYVSNDSSYDWLRQIAHILGVTMNRDLGRSIIVPFRIHN